MADLRLFYRIFYRAWRRRKYSSVALVGSTFLSALLMGQPNAIARNIDRRGGACSPLTCGGPSADGSCWCDAQCDMSGDCCSNALELCIGTSCAENSECPISHYCAKAKPSCEGIGMCLPRPLPHACEGELSLKVCGCDGETYESTCEALVQGTSIARHSACQGTQLCNRDSDCVATQFCERSVLSCSENGWCVDRPFACDPPDGHEVCGCDGQTYPSLCLAQAAGVSVARLEPCAGQVGNCAGPDHLACEDLSACLDKDDGCDPAIDDTCWGYCAGYCGGRAHLTCGDANATCFDLIDECDPAQGDLDCRGFCAVSAPSCQGRCDERGLDLSCWCDDYCVLNGDCCSDRALWCSDLLAP